MSQQQLTNILALQAFIIQRGIDQPESEYKNGAYNHITDFYATYRYTDLRYRHLLQLWETVRYSKRNDSVTVFIEIAYTRYDRINSEHYLDRITLENGAILAHNKG